MYFDFQKEFYKVQLQRQVKSHGLGIKLDRAVAYRHEAKGSSGWRNFKLQISFDWSTTRIDAKAYIIVYLHQ